MRVRVVVSELLTDVDIVVVIICGPSKIAFRFYSSSAK